MKQTNNRIKKQDKSIYNFKIVVYCTMSKVPGDCIHTEYLVSILMPILIPINYL